VEVEYFIALCKLPVPQLKRFNLEEIPKLRDLYIKFSEEDAIHVKEIEKSTNHDVKAVEYFLREKFEELHLGQYREFIHFGLTSQDINNTAFPIALKQGFLEVYKPLLDQILIVLKARSREWKKIPMLAHTHGQPASPTTVGKEFFVFAERIEKQMNLLEVFLLRQNSVAL